VRNTTHRARVQMTLQRYKELRDIIAILGMDELSPKTSWPCPAPGNPALPVAAVHRCRSVHRFAGQVCFTERHHQGLQDDRQRRMRCIAEQAFYMVGGIEEAFDKAKTLE